VGAWDLERKERKEGKTGENHDKKEISCLETRLDSVEFCISSCLSRMAKMEVWMRKVQDKMDGVVPEVIDFVLDIRNDRIRR